MKPSPKTFADFGKPVRLARHVITRRGVPSGFRNVPVYRGVNVATLKAMRAKRYAYASAKKLP